jgi:hypothetical protein
MPRITLGSLVLSSTISAVIVARDSRLSRLPITFDHVACAVGRIANASRGVAWREYDWSPWAIPTISMRQQIVVMAANLIQVSFEMIVELGRLCSKRRNFILGDMLPM